WVGGRMGIPAVASALMLWFGGLLQGASLGAQTGQPEQVLRYAFGALAYWPTIALVIAVTALLAAWLPRAATALGWALSGHHVLLAPHGAVAGIPDELVQQAPSWAVAEPGRHDEA